MLLAARISNFGPIDTEQRLSMEAGRARGKREHLLSQSRKKLLRFTAIYGANGAGKSTFLKGLHFAKSAIIQGSPTGASTRYNRTSEDNIKRPSVFAFDIALKRHVYEYGFEILLSEQRFVREWLIERTPKGDKPLFTRDLESGEYTLGIVPSDDPAYQRLNFTCQDLRTESQALFLREMNRNKGDLYLQQDQLAPIQDVYLWFAKQLVFIYPDESDISAYSLFDSEDNSTELKDIMHRFGIDITSFHHVSTTLEKMLRNIPPALQKQIQEDIDSAIATMLREKNNSVRKMVLRSQTDYYMVTVNTDGTFDVTTLEFSHGSLGRYGLEEESDGTRRILELIEILLAPRGGVTYIIDEIDRSLHPLLSEAFIREYLNQSCDVRTQLITTTHESRLLNTKVLRKDEIWFVNKTNGCAKLHRFDEQELAGVSSRTDIKIETAYLSGRYGGVPHIISDQEAD